MVWVTAVAQVQSLAWELSHATGVVKGKKRSYEKKKNVWLYVVMDINLYHFCNVCLDVSFEIYVYLKSLPNTPKMNTIAYVSYTTLFKNCYSGDWDGQPD